MGRSKKDKVLDRGGRGSTAYVVFVNFGTPMHYLPLEKVYQKVREFTPYSQNWPKKHQFCRLKSATAKKSTPQQVVAVVTNMGYSVLNLLDFVLEAYF